MSKDVIIPLGIRDVDIIKNHRDDFENRDNNNVHSLTRDTHLMQQFIYYYK